MQTIQHDPNDDLRPCTECPYILKRFLLSPLCAKPVYRDPVTGKSYQPCRTVRGMPGGHTINGYYQQCLGYNAEKHATVSKKVGL